MKIGFVSLGCPKNLVDSEVMLGMAERDGHEITTDASQADVLVVNTCAFIDRAKQESIDAILEMAEIKKQVAGRKLVVTGCLAERYREELKREIPEIDAVFGTGEVPRLVELLSGSGLQAPGSGAIPVSFYRRDPGSEPGTRSAEPVFGVDLPTYLYDASTPRKRVTPGHYAYIKIAEGCDYKCAFCIIPKMRGHYRSRPIDSIVQEARNLAAQGVKELLLISQDSTFYGIDRGERGALPKLLRALNEVDGIEWIRLLYLYPTTINDEVIDAIADLDKVVKYIDLPLQHASDAVLKRMKRPGTRKSYVRLLDNIRARIPGVALRTTFIVGFPGETADDFAALEQFITEVGFDHVGVFTYSHEEGTSAHALEDDVPAATKKKRQDRLMARQRDIVAARQQRRLGERTRLVVDGRSPEHELVLQGRLPGQAPEIDPVVYLTDCDPSAYPSGAFVNVEIVGAEGYDLVARPLDDSRLRRS
ncbi:MAG: ribosomal protein S12 methylthiotransferase RimO [Acidobacteria bacterium RIFCSPLOWO2_12_FULL_66_10]|nr:MAG: ribosomal protein S12 methylthiotransferase RimO [Acidobacteria bacterium RIFCSPLOWO2_12_FULL_66_10]